MAIPAPQDNRPPEEAHNPGQQNIDDLVDKEFNPDDYQRRQEQPATNPTDLPNDDAGSGSLDRRKDIKAKEDEPDQHENTVGRGYTGKPGGDKRTGFWRGPSSGKGWRQKRLGISAAVLAASAAASIAIFLALLPLKILHIVNNLENRFFATSQNALQNETNNLLKRYITRHVLPSYKSCGTTVSRGCSVSVVGTNPATNLYKSWANARLENKLATNYGIEFEKRADGWYLKTPHTDSKGINIGQEGEHIDDGFKKANIGEIRTAVKNETKWYRVYLRFKVGKLLEEKYGIRRCLIFCRLTDPLANKVAEQKIAAKLFLAQRVLVPRTQTLGIAVECLLNGCTATDYHPSDAETGVDGALAGSPEDGQSDKAIREGLTKLAANYDITDKLALDALVETYNKMADKGFQNYIISEGLSKLPFVSEAAAGGAADKIPIVGWIDLLSRVIGAGDNASANLKKLGYITNATAAVSLFSMYRTYADEIKTGHVNATEVGSLTDSLGPGNNKSSKDPQIGGNVGAEGAPLYSSLIDNQPSTTISSTSLGNFLSTKVFAATSSGASQTNSYKCNDGNAVPAGKPVCNEEILGIGNHYADLLHDFFHLPGIDIFTQIASIWRDTLGHVFNGINGVFGYAIQAIIVPLDASCSIYIGYATGYCEMKDLANQYLPQIENAIVQYLIPNPFSSNMSGGRTFDMMAAGADVSGNDSAHTTLGGQQLTDQQVATIQNDQFNDTLQQYNNQSFLARLKDTDSPYSPISRFAMAMPTSWNSAQRSFASIFSSPFHNLSHIFSIIFSPTKALAATAQSDPFGVVQYGYPAGTIPSDPETYWDQNCSDNAAYAYRKTNDWNTAASQTKDQNEMPLNTSTNPCLLIKATTGSAGAVYDSNLLTQDDLSN